MTHRAFSRNASSQRATPFARTQAPVESDPFVPSYWSIQQPGMQARARFEHGTPEAEAAEAAWRRGAQSAVETSRTLSAAGLHKEIANRVLAPFQMIDVVMTATSLDNFFALRCHPDAEPHMRILAWKMADEYYARSTPVVRRVGADAVANWHLPFISDEERSTVALETLKRASAARAARVSVKPFDGSKIDIEADLRTFERLVAGINSGTDYEPPHTTPLEHQCTPMADATAFCGPLRGWHQFRKEIPNETMAFDYKAAVERGWRDLAFACTTG